MLKLQVRWQTSLECTKSQINLEVEARSLLTTMIAAVS
jgi:hypothetical protein